MSASHDHGQAAHCLEVASKGDGTGIYHPVLRLDGDEQVMDGHSSATWMDIVVRAAAEAEYDAATVAMLLAKGTDRQAVGMLLEQMRGDRVRPDHGPGPLGLDITALVSATTGQPMLTLSRDGQELGQWTPGEARQHISSVRDILAVSALDTAAHTTLAGVIGLPPEIAAAAIADTDHYRTYHQDDRGPGPDEPATPPAPSADRRQFTGGVMAAEVRHKYDKDLPEPIPGHHLWAFFGIWRSADPGGDRQHLDQENLLTIQGPLCLTCELPYSELLAAVGCTGDPKRTSPIPDSPPSITCPKCGMTSYSPTDVAEGYCGNCHDWTTDPHVKDES